MAKKNRCSCCDRQLLNPIEQQMGSCIECRRIAVKSNNGARMPESQFTREDAIMLTEEIKHTTVRLWELLEKAHKQQAWNLLGYSSWAQYVMAEFGMSKNYAHKILNQAEVIRAFETVVTETAGSVPRYTPDIPERQARRIKGALGETIGRTKELLDAGVEPQEAISQAIQETEAVIQKAAAEAYDDPLYQMVPILEAIEKMRQIRPADDVVDKIGGIHGWEQVKYYADRLAFDMEYLTELREIMQGHLARRA